MQRVPGASFCLRYRRFRAIACSRRRFYASELLREFNTPDKQTQPLSRKDYGTPADTNGNQKCLSRRNTSARKVAKLPGT